MFVEQPWLQRVCYIDIYIYCSFSKIFIGVLVCTTFIHFFLWFSLQQWFFRWFSNFSKSILINHFKKDDLRVFFVYITSTLFVWEFLMFSLIARIRSETPFALCPIQWCFSWISRWWWQNEHWYNKTFIYRKDRFVWNTIKGKTKTK